MANERTPVGVAWRGPTQRVWQAVALLSVSTAACGQPASTAQAPTASGDKPFTVHEVADFTTPWAMDFLPGSGVRLTKMALLSEREGTLWLVDTANGNKQKVDGVPAAHVAGQGGLGDVVAHPDFASNRRVYLSYVEKGEGDLSGAVLGYGTLEMGKGAPRLTGFKIIWRQSPKVDGNGHFSHRIAFGPDKTIYLSSGDRQKMTPAQDATVDLGKIIQMDGEGQRIGGAFVTTGHRNILGLSFDAEGRLWETEMGPQGGDELNLIVKGSNYGWPRVSNGSHYDGEAIPDHAAGDGFAAPKTWWTPSISPGGLLIYTGDKFAAWKGDALIPALSGQALIRVDIDGDTATKTDQWAMGARIRSVEQGPDGSVYLLEDGGRGSQGRLLRLDPVMS